jgi:hypothetical protein
MPATSASHSMSVVAPIVPASEPVSIDWKKIPLSVFTFSERAAMFSRAVVVVFVTVIRCEALPAGM